MAKKTIYTKMAEIIANDEQLIRELWIEQIMTSGEKLVDLLGEEEIKRSTRELLMEFTKALVSGVDISLEPYAKIRSILETVSVEGARQNLKPSETATFIFSMKDAILPTLLVEYKTENQDEVVGAINRLIDSLGLFTFETFMETKEKLIREQQKSLLEVTAPVVRVWDEILMVPLIGLLDSTRTQLVMETLLDGLERTQSKVAILDISGIPAVDSLVAKHLLTTVSAVRLMGAECIITGISSRISQTMVQIGIDLSGITTKSSMADGLKVAFSMTDKKVVPK